MEDKKGQKRKYILFKKEGTDSGPKLCAFFASEAGCRNGAACLFLHSKDGQTQATKATTTATATASASLQPPPVMTPLSPHVHKTVPAANNAPTSNKKVKVEVKLPDGNKTPAIGSVKVPSSEEEDSSLLFGAVNVALNGYTPVSASLRRGQHTNSTGKLESRSGIEVLDHQDIAKVLSTSGTSHATMGAKSLQKNLKNKFDSVAENSSSKFEVPQGVPVSHKKSPAASSVLPLAPSIPSSRNIEDNLLHEALSLVAASKVVSAKAKCVQDLLHPDAVEWAPLVEMTRASPKYEKDYLSQVESDGWCRPHLPNREGYPVLAIDCEMCSTIDPLTNIKNPMQLIRFSLISQTEVLVDSLVNPEFPIADMRTYIHGITEEEVTNVKFTLRHAQAILKAYCGEGSVLVGHALYNDLRTLKFNHTVVVDTSYLYSIENEPGQAPSIRDISEAVLNVNMETIHDSVMDAKASLNAAEHVLKNGLHSPIQRSASSSARQLSTALMIHRIPQGCEESALSDMMVKLCAILPTLVQPIQWSRDNSGAENGKTMIFFPTKEHADLAFEGLPGPNRPDKSNRPQKRAYLKGGGYMCIRKNYA